ncbi:34126_t:CDS:2, partial [Racocetra persica]
EFSSTNPVRVFVDNSNLWTEGKYTVGNLERLAHHSLSPDDSLWTHIWNQGFDVNIFDRDREQQTIISNDPGVFVWIARDRDYEPLIKQALKYN